MILESSASPVFFMEKNIYGAWVVYGAMGIRQYIGHTKREAKKKYTDEYNKNHIVNQKGE